MRRIILTSVMMLAFAVAFASTAAAGPGTPDFTERIYADGMAWGTKVTRTLPAPNDHNMDSYDKFFVFTNAPMDQLPVGEAAPGNPDFNGGRWYTHTVTWTEAGFEAHGDVPILKSYDEIMVHYNLGHLTITAGTPGPPPPPYFSCPLLPVK